MIFGFIFVVILVSFFVFPAAKGFVEPNTVWSRTYGGKREDIATSLVVASDGGYAMAGYTRSFGINLYSDYYDFWLVKTDKYGNMEWNKTYGGLGAELGNSLIVASDGGYAMAGGTESFGAGSDDFRLVKTEFGSNIPEFPSSLIPPIFMVATILVVIISEIRLSPNRLIRNRIVAAID